MRKFLCILIFVATLSKAQTFMWAKNGVATVSMTAVDLVSNAIDANSNIYVAGIFGANPGDIVIFGTHTLTGTGGWNVLLVKYDSTGNVVWAKNTANSGNIETNYVSVDPDDNVFIAGDFTGSTLAFGTTTLVNNGNPWNDAFLTKYDSNGNIIWAKSAGGTEGDYASCVSADLNGNAFITGAFESPTVALGSNTLNLGTNTAGNAFIAKYDPNGNVLWAKSLVGDGATYDIDEGDQGYSVSADVNGNVYLTGSFYSPTLTVGSTTLINSGTGNNANAFLAKYDANGNVLWAKKLGDSLNVEAMSVSSYSSGVFVTGYYTDTLALGTITLTNAPTNTGTAVFIAKYDANGNVIWAKSSGGINEDTGFNVASFHDGVFLTGAFSSSVMVFGTNTLTAPAFSVDPMFITQYDASGNVICALGLSSGGDDANAVCVDKLGYAYIAGDYESNPFIVGTHTFVQVGNEDAFLFRFYCQTPEYPASTTNTTVTTTIKTNQLTSSLTIFPNPNSGSFKIQLDNEIENGELILINTLGQKVFEQKIIRGENNINTHQLSKGIYSYSILENIQRVSTGKIIIE